MRMQNPRIDPPLSAKVSYLSQPQTYGDTPTRVDVIETHMSWLFLTDEYVYKLKKPIGNHLMDFSTTAARHRNAIEELRLNRRLAADIYLDVIPLSFSEAGEFHLGEADNIAEWTVDWLVLMRRLPAADMLDQRLLAHAVTAAEITAVATLLADFYASAPAVPISEHEYLAHFKQVMEINRAELCTPLYQLETADIEALCLSQSDFIHQRQTLLNERATERHIIEAHGDLRPEHICVATPPVAIDCLEFNRALRLLDPVDELSYLALECEFIAPDMAVAIENTLTDIYRQRCHDRAPPQLIHFYKSLRATTRARLMALHLRDHPQTQWPKWIGKAKAYLTLAKKYAALFEQFDD